VAPATLLDAGVIGLTGNLSARG